MRDPLASDGLSASYETSERPHPAKRLYWQMRTDPRVALVDANAAAQAWTARTTRRVVDLSGVKVKLGSHCSLRMAREILEGSYEGPERTLLSQVLEPRDVVMECGSAIGVIATLCAKKIGSQRVHTFEASPRMIQAARETFALNDVSPRIVHGALGAQSGTREFFTEADFWSSSTFKRSASARRIEVPGLAIGDIIGRIHPTFLIVDIEGGEREIVDHIIAFRIPKVLIEFHPTVIGQAETTRAKLAFEQAGYVAELQMSEGNQIFYRLDQAPITVVEWNGPEDKAS